MQHIVAYVRNLLGLCEDEPTVRGSFKRDRPDFDIPFEDDTPAIKRHKQLKRSFFPDTISTNDMWEKDERPAKNVRYVPIQIEAGHPSTSTPIETSEKYGRKLREVPIQLEMTENGASTPSRKFRHCAPNRPVISAVVDDDDEEVVCFNNKQNAKKPNRVFIELDEEENNQYQNKDDDVIFVKKVKPPTTTPYQYFVPINDHNEDERDENDSVQYIRVNRKSNGRPYSPKTYSKFKAPPGVTKAYKKIPTTTLPRWMHQTQKSPTISNLRNKYLNQNGGIRSTISDIFNLDEKRNYQELIRRVAGTTKFHTVNKPSETINLAEDSASFRMTRRSQKKALDEIKLVERGLRDEKEIESTKEYDPVTVASINSSDSEVEVIPSGSSTSSSIRIDPINTLKDSYKDRAVTSSDWLAKLDCKYKKKKKEKQEKIHDALRESDIISKVNYEQNLAHLEHKLKYELSIPESLIEEVQPTVELPELTPEQEKLVSRAIGPGPPGQLLVEKFNLRIHRRDLQTLSGLNWLNDEVINFYMNLLMQRSEEKNDLPKVYAANTFFYPKLMQSGQVGLRRWTRKVDIFSHDLMVVPVHLGVHWCVSLINFREKKINYLDSMGGKNLPCLQALMQYLRDEHQDKKGKPFDDSGWKAECLKDIPQQMNGSDCGMFACTFAEFSARGAPYTFNQSHMPYLRRKAAFEILQGKLLL